MLCGRDLRPRPSLWGYYMGTTVIRNADSIVAYEGNGHRYSRGDVAFTGDKLVNVGGTYAGQSDREIDGRGFMVMPGLVNIHSHPMSERLNEAWNDELGAPQLYNSSFCEIMPLLRPGAEGMTTADTVALAAALLSAVVT